MNLQQDQIFFAIAGVAWLTWAIIACGFGLNR